MDGFLIVNKPKGITSHDVVAFARRRLKIKKIGHSGTLDPLASGVLVLGVGVATRLLEYLVGCEKEYEAEITFGSKSNTDDSEGKITPISFAKEFSREDLEKVFPQFLGEISQIPPQFSAIKIKGKASYKRMREGEEVEMQPRKVKLFALKLSQFHYPKAEIKIHCGSGFYVRALARDLGEAMRSGGYLSKLVRSRVGKFTLKQAIPLKSIREEKILPLEEGVTFPHLNLTSKEKEEVLLGKKIPSRVSEEWVGGFYEGKLVAILQNENSKHSLKPQKVFSQSFEKEEKKEDGFLRRKIGS